MVHGDHRGRQLGYPTANLEIANNMTIPQEGIYAGYLIRTKTSEVLPAAISIGNNPTFAGTEKRIEGYVLDRTDLDLYADHVANGISCPWLLCFWVACLCLFGQG